MKSIRKSIGRFAGEYTIPLLLCASLILSCIIISEKKYYWNDELYSYYFLADRSFSRMIAAFHDKINNTPILYFLLGWLWARAFGAGELSLRLFSSLGFCIAGVVVWVTLRRTYAFFPTALGVLAVFCTSDLILNQNAEARMYGLFLAVCSLGLWQFDRLNRSAKPSRLDLWLNIAIHAAIVNTHLFGLFYSGAIFFSHLLYDAYRKVWNPRIYLSIVLGVLSLVFYIPAFLVQIDAGRPRSWIPIPTRSDLLGLIDSRSSSFFSLQVLVWILLTACLLFAIDSYKPQNPDLEKRSLQERQNSSLALLLFATSFLIVPIFAWIVSRTVKPIFIDRYLIPTALSWAIIITHASSYLPIFSELRARLLTFTRTSPTEILQTLGKFALGSILLAYILFQPVKFALLQAKQSPPDYHVNEYGYRDLPIVVQFGGRFIPTFYYSRERERYFFILDWESAVNEDSGLFTPQEYKHLDAFKRVYPDIFDRNILPSEEFLQTHDRFLVLDSEDPDRKCPLKVTGLKNIESWTDIQCPQWLEKRILANPDYRVKTLIQKDWETVVVVEKKS